MVNNVPKHGLKILKTKFMQQSGDKIQHMGRGMQKPSGYLILQETIKIVQNEGL